MSAVKILQDTFGIDSHVNENPLVTQLQVASTQFLSSNFDRLAFVIVNLSENDVYISPDLQSAADHGIFLVANGGVASANILEDFALVNREWSGIAVGAAADIFVIEVEGEIVV